MPRGKFITLEGGEGAGKSTQAKLLAQVLAGRGLAVDQTREPGGTAFAEALRDVLLGEAPRDPVAEALAHFAARADHVARRILPSLCSGAWVVCDRFADGTRAYQGAAGADPSRIEAIADAALGAFSPDLTLVLDMPVEQGLLRARDANRYERLGLDFHRQVRARFLDIAAAAPSRCMVIDATDDIETVAARVAAAVHDRLDAAL